MPKESTGCGRRAKPILAAGAVLWRPQRRSRRAGGRGHPPSPIRRLVAAQGQGRSRRDRTRGRGARDRGGDGLSRASRATAHAVSYPVDQGIKKVRYWAARSVGGEFSAERRGRRTQMAAGRRGDEGVELSARPKGAAPIHETACRHPDGADRPARAPREASPDTRATTDKRPLDKHGRAQAESLVGLLLAFGAGELFAAARVRCRADARSAGRGAGCDHQR